MMEGIPDQDLRSVLEPAAPSLDSFHRRHPKILTDAIEADSFEDVFDSRAVKLVEQELIPLCKIQD